MMLLMTPCYILCIGEWMMDDIKEEQEIDISVKKNKKEKDIHFLVGLLSGMLITLLTFGIILFCTRGIRFISNYKAVKNVEESGATSVTGNKEVVTTRLISKLGAMENIADKYYYGDYSSEDIENGIYSGFVDGLNDKYAKYYSKEELKKLQEDTGGYYCGIGAYVSYNEEIDYCEIAGTIEGTPAEAAGLREGDIIYKIDDTDCQGMDLSDVVALIKGDEGTVVHLSLVRNEDIVEFDVTRAKVNTISVSHEMLDDNIGYIAVSEFDGSTADQFTEALALLKNDGARGLIIDLRGNLGGNVDAVCQMCRDILPEGLIVYTEDKYGRREEYKCDGSNELEIPLVMLVNSYSASASEIMTGAVKDYGKGTIVGTVTYGKGIVQRVISLSDGSAFKLTTSKYFTPNGVCIHGTGIEPDIEVELDVDAYYENGTDNQLDAAIAEIHRKWETAD